MTCPRCNTNYSIIKPGRSVCESCVEEWQENKQFRKVAQNPPINSHCKCVVDLPREEIDRARLYLAEQQNGKCKICERELKFGKTCHLDHDHATGQVRGVLCCSCNHLLGLAHDSEAILYSALRYLRESRVIEEPCVA